MRKYQSFFPLCCRVSRAPVIRCCFIVSKFGHFTKLQSLLNVVFYVLLSWRFRHEALFMKIRCSMFECVGRILAAEVVFFKESKWAFTVSSSCAVLW